MFFVAFSVRFKQYLIVPKNWINDMNWEKHVNYSINRNQEYRVYYSNKKDAFENKIPDGNFAPNFAAQLTDYFLGEGCDICKLVHYFGKYIKLVHCFQRNK